MNHRQPYFSAFPGQHPSKLGAGLCLIFIALSGAFLWAGIVCGEEKRRVLATPVFVDGEAQVVTAFEDPANWIRHDLWVEAPFDSDDDGKPDRLHVSVTRPQQTESEGLKLPVIYVTSPYFAGTGSNTPEYFWDVRHELGEEPPAHAVGPEIKRRGQRPVISESHTKQWVPRGYIVAHSSSPGTGLSQGCPTVGGSNESLAPMAVIDWLCGRAPGYSSIDGNEEVHAYWSSGKVGMTGTSYNGTLPLAAATTGVQGLEAIIPIAPNTSYYHYYRSHGLVRHPGGYLGEDIDVLYDFIHSGDSGRRDYCNCQIRDTEMAEGMDRITGDYNQFWASRDYLNQLDHVTAATLMAHGFNDWNVMPEHSYRISQALKSQGVPVQIYYHQGGHGGPPPMRLMNRWFTRYLHGVENGVENDPKAWIVREGNKPSDPTPYPDYPHPDAASVKWYLQPGAPEHGRLRLERGRSPGRESLVDNVSFDGSTLAKAEWTNHRLMYVTEVLAEPVHISGVAELTIELACNRPAANLSVWMVSLPWNDKADANVTDNIITRGWADLRNHRSLTRSEALEPGRFYRLTFSLQPDDQIIPAGQQIGLMIFSSDRDFTLWPKPGTELTVNLENSYLSLPIVEGRSAIRFEDS